MLILLIVGWAEFHEAHQDSSPVGLVELGPPYADTGSVQRTMRFQHAILIAVVMVVAIAPIAMVMVMMVMVAPVAVFFHKASVLLETLSRLNRCTRPNTGQRRASPDFGPSGLQADGRIV